MVRFGQFCLDFFNLCDILELNEMSLFRKPKSERFGVHTVDTLFTTDELFGWKQYDSTEQKMLSGYW